MPDVRAPESDGSCTSRLTLTADDCRRVPLAVPSRGQGTPALMTVLQKARVSLIRTPSAEGIGDRTALPGPVLTRAEGPRLQDQMTGPQLLRWHPT
jgi:hypothetical protein